MCAVQKHLLNGLSQHPGQLMAYDRHACLMADKCEPVTANASSAGLACGAAYSPKTRPDTGPSYITALGLEKKKINSCSI